MKTKIQHNKMTAIYCRVSTFDQEKGLKSQEKALKDYCRNHGLNGKTKGGKIKKAQTTPLPLQSCQILYARL